MIGPERMTRPNSRSDVGENAIAAGTVRQRTAVMISASVPINRNEVCQPNVYPSQVPAGVPMPWAAVKPMKTMDNAVARRSGAAVETAMAAVAGP